MSDNNLCQEHSGHVARINSLEDNKAETWNAIQKVNERIDGMKNWVIAGMSSLILQLVIVLISMALRLK